MRHYLRLTVLSMTLTLAGVPAYAFEGPQEAISGNVYVQQCYGLAMVGMDSVINSRMGVPPEHALELARMTHVSSPLVDTFSTDLLNYILNAYFWEGSPHSYAINVFYACAQQQGPLHSASSEGVTEP